MCIRDRPNNSLFPLNNIQFAEAELYLYLHAAKAATLISVVWCYLQGSIRFEVNRYISTIWSVNYVLQTTARSLSLFDSAKRDKFHVGYACHIILFCYYYCCYYYSFCYGVSSAAQYQPTHFLYLLFHFYGVFLRWSKH